MCTIPNQEVEPERSSDDMVRKIDEIMMLVESKLPISPARIEPDDPQYSDWMTLLSHLIKLRDLRQTILSGN